MTDDAVVLTVEDGIATVSTTESSVIAHKPPKPLFSSVAGTGRSFLEVVYSTDDCVSLILDRSDPCLVSLCHW
jgi:hypothetical protein